MFGLIVTIISLILVSLVGIATLYYGGDVLKGTADRASVSRYISEGTQVQGALELFRIDNAVLPTGTNDQIKQQLLDGHYLKSWPEGQWSLVNDYAVRNDLSSTVCTQINAKLGVSTIPTCGDPAIAGRNLCCQTL